MFVLSKSPPPPCPLNTTIFLFIYIISSLCLKQRKKMEQISEKKTSPSNREKKKKKVDVKEKKTEDTSSRHRLFSIYWAWKYDIKNFRILELCLPLITELWNVEITQPFNLARGQRAKKKCNCTNHQLHKKYVPPQLNCETEWISLKYETGKTEDLLMWQNINSII